MRLIDNRCAIADLLNPSTRCSRCTSAQSCTEYIPCPLERRPPTSPRINQNKITGGGDQVSAVARCSVFSRRRQGPSQVDKAICVTADREKAEDVGREFAARLEAVGIDARVLLWADDTRWADLVTGDIGLQTDAARERVAAMNVLAGRTQPAASRDSLAESLVGDREPVAKLLPATRESARENTAKLEGRWALSRVQRFHRDGAKLSDTDAARLLVAVESIPIRDRLWPT